MLLSNKLKIFLLLFLFSVACLYFCCAKVAPPPGGPADIKGPTIIQTIPADLAVGVSLNQRIEIEISEWYDEQSFEDAFFISPEPPGKIKFKFKLKKVIVSFPEGLSENRTYVVTIGSGFRDLNRNSMESSHTLVFSTGYEFAHGVIQGKVEGGKNLNLVAALYNLAEDYSLLEDKGEYLTQTGKEGDFSFGYLPPAEYRLFVFNDKDKDRLFNPGAEDLGLACRDFSVNEDTSEFVSILMGVTFDKPPIIAGIDAVNNKTIRLKLDRPLEFLPDITQIDVFDTLNQLQLRITDVIAHPVDSTRVILFTETQDSVTYSFKIFGGIDFLGMTMDDSLFFRGNIQSDTTAPQILQFLAESDSTGSLIKIFTSEETNTAKLREAVTFADTGRSKPEITVKKERYGVYSLKSPAIIAGDSIALNLQNLVDNYGNGGPDTVMIYVIAEMEKEEAEDNKGTISGKALFFGNEPLVIILQQNKTEISQQVLYDSGVFKFANVNSGYYTFKAFIDRDANRRYDYGLWQPFRNAEKFVVIADSFRVRERWETTGVEISIGAEQ